jgi:phosphoenolpyruvate-protein phosphotransferase/dihydroxyacetone kinase phosphotransfer subunit
VISIVVVSHSRALADAAVGLAREMVDADAGPKVVVAAGLDETTFGTDATAVSAAIEEVDSPDGVLVLLDLGSALLSAEMALEFVDPDVAGRVRLSSAPLVEGLVAAVVLAATGADLGAVAAEAEQGLLAKQTHLGHEIPSSGAGPDVEAAAGPTVTAEVSVTNEHGLHARPAAKVVGLLRSFDAQVSLTNLDTGRGPVNAGSLSAVATLDARQGHRVQIAATGPQADQAVRAFEELAARAFDDLPAPSVGTGAAAGAGGSGSGLDLALGPALVRRASVDTSAYEPGDVETETMRSRDAVSAVRARLGDLERRTTETSGEQAGAIFVAQTALLDDPDVIALVDEDLASGRSAVDAWTDRLGAVAAGFETLADPYQRERAGDVRSVQGSVLRSLTGEEEPDDGDEAGDPVVLVVDELDAATAASIDVERVAGVAVIARGDTGHGVIIASSRGIPLTTGVGTDADDVRNGQVVAFSRGSFSAHPSDEDVRRWPDYVAERRRERAEVVEAAREPASTSDGVRVPVLANVASLADAESAAANGADGSGLVRTEVLFGGRATAPSAEEQAQAFLALAEAMDGKRLTIRTWDIGGDKPLPFLPMAAEANPFLGVRGIRAFPFDPRGPTPGWGLLHDQLAAICQTARETPLRVMFPMVTTADEVSLALGALDRAAGEGGRPDGLEVGIMVEVPAAAMAVDVIAGGLDFVSIGTNDLTQYATATDRGNDAVADLADPLNPGVIRLIDQVCRHRPGGVEVAVCGDLASRPEWTALLLGLGVDELSCTPPRVSEVKAAVRRTDRSEARTMAQRVLRSGDRGEITELMSMSGHARPDEDQA